MILKLADSAARLKWESSQRQDELNGRRQSHFDVGELAIVEEGVVEVDVDADVDEEECGSWFVHVLDV
eukprot:4556367-Amphidinium_carterae.1